MSASARLFKIGFQTLMLLALASPLALAQNIKIFVDAGDIKGESVDKDHKDWIDAVAYSESALRAASSPGHGTTAASFSDIKILKSVDKASPKLREVLAKGTHIPEVNIEFWQTGGDGSRRYLSIKLEEVLVTEVTMTTQTPDVSQEVVAFNFMTITWTYTSYNAQGKVTGNITVTWDLTRTGA